MWENCNPGLASMLNFFFGGGFKQCNQKFKVVQLFQKFPKSSRRNAYFNYNIFEKSHRWFLATFVSNCFHQDFTKNAKSGHTGLTTQPKNGAKHLNDLEEKDLTFRRIQIISFKNQISALPKTSN